MKPRDMYYYDEKLTFLEVKLKNSAFSFKRIVFFLKVRSDLSHLKKKRKFKNNFQDTLDPYCNCSKNIEAMMLRPSSLFTLYQWNTAVLKIIQYMNNSVLELRYSHIKLDIVLQICQFGKNKVDEIPRKI